VWCKRDGDTLLFSTTAHEKKARNLARDPRISVSVYELGNPYKAVDIRGVAHLSEDTERALPRELSQMYLDEDPPAESGDVVRLIVRVIPHKVSGFSV
jgi:PPOX class probable F420-dependent enzyme